MSQNWSASCQRHTPETSTPGYFYPEAPIKKPQTSQWKHLHVSTILPCRPDLIRADLGLLGTACLENILDFVIIILLTKPEILEPWGGPDLAESKLLIAAAWLSPKSALEKNNPSHTNRGNHKDRIFFGAGGSAGLWETMKQWKFMPSICVWTFTSSQF